MKDVARGDGVFQPTRAYQQQVAAGSGAGASGASASTVACCAPLTQEPLTEQQAAAIAPVLKALADPVRLRLLSMVLSHAGAEACVCDLNDAVDLSQPTVSHHLKVLHDVGLLDREKRGVWVYDSARPEALSALAALLGATG